MSAPKGSGTTVPQGARWARRRLFVLTGAFLLIAINPFLNYYLQIDFIQGWYQSLGIGSLWFVSPLEGLESLLITKSFYMPALVGMLIPVVLAFLLGRVEGEERRRGIRHGHREHGTQRGGPRCGDQPVGKGEECIRGNRAAHGARFGPVVGFGGFLRLDCGDIRVGLLDLSSHCLLHRPCDFDLLRLNNLGSFRLRDLGRSSLASFLVRTDLRQCSDGDQSRYLTTVPD